MSDAPTSADYALRDVRPHKLLFEQFDSEDDTRRPAWFEESPNGVTLAGFAGGYVHATVTARFLHAGAAVAVAITGCYQPADADADGPADEISDGPTILDSSPAERHRFTERAVHDLFPYLRAELQMLSGRQVGYPGIILTPDPRIEEILTANIGDRPTATGD
ncbi:hypothetical protein [Nocardia sp. NPDC004604]|uniref:hypothetical protein n=1 Tax=Nocardia sp. NPDC004604 TaxID=3157013 RepID=UPI0033B97918